MIHVGIPRSSRPRLNATIGLVLAATLTLAGCTASPGTTSPSARPTTRPTEVLARFHPRPVPSIDRLTAQQLACGRELPTLTFPTAQNEVELRRTDASVAFDLSNVARAEDGRATVVSARISATTGVEADQDAAAELGGAATAALVQGGRVVAAATAPVPAERTTAGSTDLVSVTLPATSCSSGAPLRDGRYSLVLAGPTVRYLGETVPVATAVSAITLRGGVLIGDITSAPDGPWLGSGVPTCGSAASAAALEAFARANASVRARVGLEARITGFEPHANGRGWFFTVRVRNTSGSPLTLVQGDPGSVPGGASTAVVEHGQIVSAPDALQPYAARPRAIRLAAGGALNVEADAPAAGCDLSADGTSWSPALPDTAHLAYIDLGLITRDGTGVVLTQRYDFHGKDDRPELVD